MFVEEGLLILSTCMVETGCQALVHYVWSNCHTEPLLFAVQQSGLFMKPDVSLLDFKSNWLQTFLQLWKQKPLHGQFHTQWEALITAECVYKWLRASNLKFKTAALICAAQDQALCTNTFKTNVLRTSQNAVCWMCHSATEIIFHILIKCISYICYTDYLKWHNSVASLLHKNMHSHVISMLLYTP